MNTIKIDNYYKPESKTLRLDEADLNQTDINAMQVLLKENQELREALEIKSYCKYANKCNEIYDCSREEYEDMANANMRLNVENQTLKKQLENCYCNRTDCSSRIKDSKKYDSLIQAQEVQQKEFIKYLEDEINKLKEQIKNYDIWHEVGTDINFLILKKQFYLEILKKYKEIIGVSDETNKQ